MSLIAYAEAQAKLQKEIDAANADKQPYIVLPLDVALQLAEICTNYLQEPLL